MRPKKKSAKGEIIASLREDNKRLKDLNVALVNMYTCPTQPQNEQIAGQSLPPAASGFDSGSTLNSTQDLSGCFAADYTYLNPAEALKSSLSSDPSNFDSNHDPSQYLATRSDTDYFQNSMLELIQPNDIENHHNTPSSINSAFFSPYNTPIEDPMFSNMSFASSDMPFAPSPHNSLPLPETYAHLEPTFSRRLLRTTYQNGFHMLTNTSHFPPSIISRIFGFCLAHNTTAATLEKIGRGIGLGCGGILLVDQLRWGLMPDRRDTEEGYMEVGDVEWYLLEKGFGISGADVGTDSDSRLVKGKMRSDPMTVKASKVPYGTVCDTASLDSWLMGYEPPEIFSATLPSVGINTSDAAYQAYLDKRNGASMLSNNTTGKNEKTCYLDLEKFFNGLMGHTLCLGRAAGFRRQDVEEVLNQCVIEELS